MIPSQTPLPKIPLGSWVETLINWIQTHLHGFLGLISQSGTSVNDALVDVLLAIPPLVMVVVFVLIAWLAKSWRLAVGTAVTFLLIISMGQWTNAMETLVLVTLATVTALIFAIPLGIWAARNKYVSALVRPVLDLMQTMPAFVYLIPSVLFFSIGVVPGMFATLIFAMPPGVRMTELGIKQVDKETVEAGRSFGATDWQILRGIQLPLAVPTSWRASIRSSCWPCRWLLSRAWSVPTAWGRRSSRRSRRSTSPRAPRRACPSCSWRSTWTG